jgi:hypothetical protein
MATPHPYSVSTFMLVDEGVLADMVAALNGSWQPTDEPDEVRRARLVDAARLRLYGEVDRSGWYLCTTRAARDRQPQDGHCKWVVMLLATVDSYDDAPPPEDLASLAKTYADESGLDPSTADVLAHAVLYEPVKYLVTNDVRGYKHNREHDLPARLEIITPADAVAMLELVKGEEPLSEPPPDWPTVEGPTWWVPA